jgi:hypothetical protein
MRKDTERQLLEELLEKLNQYNARDMLDGYLDSLGTEFNGRLEDLKLPVIEEVGEEHEDETIDDLDFTVHHLTTDELYSAGAHTGLDHKEALEVLSFRVDTARRVYNEEDFSNFRFYEGLPTNGQTVLNLEPLRPSLLFNLTKMLDHRS